MITGINGKRLNKNDAIIEEDYNRESLVIIELINIFNFEHFAFGR